MVVLFVDLDPHVPHFAKLPRYYFLAVLHYFVLIWFIIIFFNVVSVLFIFVFSFVDCLLSLSVWLFSFYFETGCYLMLIDLTHCHILVLLPIITYDFESSLYFCSGTSESAVSNLGIPFCIRKYCKISSWIINIFIYITVFRFYRTIWMCNSATRFDNFSCISIYNGVVLNGFVYPTKRRFNKNFIIITFIFIVN